MNNPNWLERIRGQVPRRKVADHAAQGRGSRGRLRPGVVLALLVAGLLVVAIAAGGLYGAMRSASGPASSLYGLLPTGETASTTDAYRYDTSSQRAGLVNGTTEAPGNPPPTQEDGQTWDRMIIRTATLQLRVKDVAASMDEIRSVVGGHAGYVTGSESRQEGDYTVGTMTVQVPAAQFDGAISQLRGLGIKVLNENVTSSDVTEEFTDLNSQLRNLHATEARLLDLMQRAEQIPDIMALDRELRGIQGEIERIQGRLNFLGKRAEMSTITISLYPEAVGVEPTPATAGAWDPVKIANDAWEASLKLLANIGTLVITVAVYLWWLLPLALIAAIFLRRTRRTLPAAPTATTAE